MSEALSDVMSTLRDHAPTLPSAKDARDAMASHLPSTHAKTRSKLSTAAIAVGLLAVAAAVAGLLRRRQSAPDAASIYTPPLPKP